ncbi:MAG: gas vesicle protein [Leptolyngbya sp. SIO4C1]|nr:gas vesicle protein [Leptolyngbya sp. SIO4C1]
MSQQDNFAGGFLLGTLVGGALGGLIGALTASRLRPLPEEEDFSRDLKRDLANTTPEEQMELARRGLEDKIAQLNAAIEDVRDQLGSVNGHPETLSSYDPSSLIDS